MPSSPRPFWTALSVLLTLSSPFVLYWALTRHALHVAGWLVVAWLTARLVPTLLSASPEQRWAVLQLPLIALFSALLGAISQQMWLMLALPTLTQLGFAWAFARTLRRAQMPLVERFARMQKPELSAPELQHCRQFTGVWTIALTLNAACSALLAVTGPLWLWALVGGALSYVIVGALFVVEYLIRAVRFRRLGDSWLQRLLQTHFPDHSAQP